MLKNKDGSIPETEWFSCEACDYPRLDSELARGSEPYGESYFCKTDRLCGTIGELGRCNLCELVFEEGDLLQSDDLESNFCHDCLIADREARQMERDRDWDYYHA